MVASVMRSSLFYVPLLMVAGFSSIIAAPTPVFRAQDIDTNIEIGYGLAIADVQGDGKPDILLADKRQYVWYENPTWKKHVLAENLTEKDNVCIAARDIDGDGKCEIAVGAEWNPSDTENSGAVFYLIPPEDRTQKWEAVKLHAEPTTHRMKWVKGLNNAYELVVVPLHGKGNKNGEGAGVKVLAYEKPANPRDEWKTKVLSDSMHMTHNLDVYAFPWNVSDKEAILLGGKEGIVQLIKKMDGGLNTLPFEASKNTRGAGEVRSYFSRGAPVAAVSIEPMHGNEVVYYSGVANTRLVIDDTLQDGHALASGDLLGQRHDQIVVGWRAMANRLAPVGIKMYVTDDPASGKWQTHVIDDNTMACEDLVLADLNGDGKLDIIASGRRTKNVKVYWNETNP